MTKLHFIASSTSEAQAALHDATKRYGQTPLDRADIVVALGGDGTLLETLHTTLDSQLPVYGMNRGSVGFLMNPWRVDDLEDRIAKAHKIIIHPLTMSATDKDGNVHKALAFNEVSLLREARQAAKISIIIDNVERLPELVCDGVLVSTPAGSTAYNLSAHGPILPLSANVLALTPISAFRPRRWRGAVLPHAVTVKMTILESDKRPVSATADYTEVRDVIEVIIKETPSIGRTLLFDPDHNLEERMLKEQFLP